MTLHRIRSRWRAPLSICLALLLSGASFGQEDSRLELETPPTPSMFKVLSLRPDSSGGAHGQLAAGELLADGETSTRKLQASDQQRDQDDAAFYLQRAAESSRRGDTDKMIADCNEAIRISPRLAQAYHLRGMGFAIQGELDKALSDLNKAIRLSPKELNFYLNRGRLWLDREQWNRAIMDFDEALELDANHAHAYFLRGFACKRSGQADQASRDYERAVALDPNHAEAHDALAFLLTTRPEKALRDGERAIQLATHACELIEWRNAKFWIRSRCVR